MHALIIGATGATGRALLEQLLDDASVERVTVFIRNKWVLYHKKLTAHVVDFNQLDSWKHLIVGDVLFSCLGTTRKAAGSKAGQWLVDYTYQAECARIASENQVSAYVLVSSVNASEASSFFYSRMKGQLETYIQTLSFAKVLVFRPPILIRKNSDRRLEVLSVSLLKNTELYWLVTHSSSTGNRIAGYCNDSVASSAFGGFLSFQSDGYSKNHFAD